MDSLVALVTDNAVNMLAIHTHHLLDSTYQISYVSHTLTLSITNGLNSKKEK